MPIISGAVTKSLTTWTSADGFAYSGAGLHPLARYFTDKGYAYEAVYRSQLWAQVAINKLVNLQMQLPFKVYQRGARGRDDARQSPFGQVIAHPSLTIDPVTFWTWFVLQRHIHGKSFAHKERDAGGRPVRLKLVHPSRMRYGPERGGDPERAPSRWWFVTDPRALTERPIERSEFIYWRRVDPCHPEQGLSMLEQLRDTLEMEGAARLANKALYRRGGKHSIILKTPKNFGAGTSMVLKRLADQYEQRHGGVDNWGRPLILEDGMEPVQLDHSPEDLQYVEARRLNREEVAAAADLPPPSIGILDRATFSNVTEQNRMLYRTSMPPHLQSFEAMLNFDLRDGRHGRAGLPDFGDSFYFEHLIDGVLRGSTEERIAANAQAIQTAQMTPAEARELENRPFIPGSDQLYVNSAMVPFDQAAQLTAPAGQRPAELPAGSASGQARRLDPATVSTVMGRLSRPKSLDGVHVEQLTAGLDGAATAVVGQAVEHVRDLGGDVAGLRRLIKNLGAEQL